MRAWMIAVCLAACGGGAGPVASDARVAGAVDARGMAVVDAGGMVDAAPASPPDAAPAAPPDAAPASPTHIHILIDNFCNTSTDPTFVSAPLNSGLTLTFHNHSVDYQADVWSSRGYGYLGLDLGASWNDPIPHCDGPTPYTESFAVSIAGGGGSACPGVTFSIHCQ